MITPTMLAKLREFGLNTYEAKTWAAILSKGTATASTLSELASVPRSRCYDVLESLEKKGFIMARVGRPMKYIAVNPEEAIERVKLQLHKITEEKVNALEQLKQSKIISDLNQLHKTGMKDVNHEDLTGVIKQKKNVDSHLSSMIRNAKNEVLIVTDAQDLILKAALIQNLLPSLSIKPTIRILTQKTSETLSISKRLKGFAEVKTTNQLSRFCVADNAATLLLSSTNDSDESAIWVNAPEFVNSLKDLFETKWAQN